MYRSIESWLDKIVYGDTENAFRRMIRDTLVGEDRIARHRDFYYFKKEVCDGYWMMEDFSRFYFSIRFEILKLR